MTPDALAATAKQHGDPLLDEWTGPHGGFPRFDMVRVAAFKPSIDRGMELKRLEIAAIAGHSAAPDFENTFAALDGSGRPFSRATRIFRIYTATMNDKSVQAAEIELAPVLSAFDDEIVQNEALFARLKTVYDTRATANLLPEQQRLVDIVYTNFARRGAALGKAEKSRLKEINKRLASLFTTFRQNHRSVRRPFKPQLRFPVSGSRRTLRISRSSSTAVPNSGCRRLRWSSPKLRSTLCRSPKTIWQWRPMSSKSDT